MKPISINLMVEKKIWEKSIFFLTVAFTLITFGLTCVNTYDYFANKQVIKTYEQRLELVKKQVKARKIIVKTQPEEDAQFKKEQAYIKFLMPIIQKNMISIPSVLSEIERHKPEKITINNINFSKDGKNITIKGESKYISSISDFFMNMKSSDQFQVDLSKEEFGSDKTVYFELTVLWKQ